MEVEVIQKKGSFATTCWFFEIFRECIVDNVVVFTILVMVTFAIFYKHMSIVFYVNINHQVFHTDLWVIKF